MGSTSARLSVVRLAVCLTVAITGRINKLEELHGYGCMD